MLDSKCGLNAQVVVFLCVICHGGGLVRYLKRYPERKLTLSLLFLLKARKYQL